MGQGTGIEWATDTFNPWWGCERISPACALCYADREAARHGFPGQFAREAPHREFGDAHWNEPRRWARRAAREGIRRRVFSGSMCDVFEDHPVAARHRPRLFELIEATPELDWLLLTKRPENAAAMVPPDWMAAGFPQHVWLGFSAESQRYFDQRWPVVADLPVRGVRFCSYEPALGAVDFTAALHDSTCLQLSRSRGAQVARALEAAITEQVVRPLVPELAPEETPHFRYIRGMGEPCTYSEPREVHLDWLIAGGESGLPSQPVRPSHPDWIRSARDQAVAAGVAFLFKQWGEWVPWEPRFGTGEVRHVSERDGRWGDSPARVDVPGGDHEWRSDTAPVVRVGKKRAGRLLDGRTWDEVPAPGG